MQVDHRQPCASDDTFIVGFKEHVRMKPVVRTCDAEEIHKTTEMRETGVDLVTENVRRLERVDVILGRELKVLVVGNYENMGRDPALGKPVGKPGVACKGNLADLQPSERGDHKADRHA